MHRPSMRSQRSLSLVHRAARSVQHRLRCLSTRGVAAGVLLAAALVAGTGMTLAVDRLETAARTRAALERQTAALQDRLLPAAVAVPALQQVRDGYDQAIGQAADLARASIWGGLLLLLLAAAGLERRYRQVGPVAAAPIGSEAQRLHEPPVSAQAQAQAAAAQMKVQVDSSQHPAADAPQRRERLGDIAREMRALRDWIGAESGGDAPAPQHRHQEAAVHSVRFHLAA